MNERSLLGNHRSLLALPGATLTNDEALRDSILDASRESFLESAGGVRAASTDFRKRFLVRRRAAAAAATDRVASTATAPTAPEGGAQNRTSCSAVLPNKSTWRGSPPSSTKIAKASLWFVRAATCKGVRPRRSVLRRVLGAAFVKVDRTSRSAPKMAACMSGVHPRPSTSWTPCLSISMAIWTQPMWLAPAA